MIEDYWRFDEQIYHFFYHGCKTPLKELIHSICISKQKLRSFIL